MPLSCKTVVVGVIFATLGCHEPAAPPTPPVGYTLVDINGRSLPTFVSPIPEGPTIISATLQLDASGSAKLTEHRREMAGGNLTYTTNYTYKITGNQIQFDYSAPCPPNALCVEPPKGTITGSSLSLAMYGTYSGITYNFRLVAPD